MSDDKKPLGLRNSSGPGHVKQSFSHGRSKSVVVEKKRKRVIVPGKVAQTLLVDHVLQAYLT